MTRQFKSTIKIALIGAAFCVSGASSMATASGDWGGYGQHRHTDSCGCLVREYAGRISIDGRTTSIRSDRPIPRQIAQAFRNAGYRAWVANGCVRVDYGWHRPRVRWYRDRYRAKLNWDHGELSISVRQSRGDHWNGRRYQPRRSAIRSFRWGYCD